MAATCRLVESWMRAVTFPLLYGFFIIRHDRRQIVHCNVTRHPTGSWIVQQREAFRYESASKFLLFDHDQKYSPEVLAVVRSLPIACVRTSIPSPWQNGVAERWVGSCRRHLLDHISAVNERHLKRLLADYIRYYHVDRTHLGLRKQTPGWQTAFRKTGFDSFASATRWPSPSLRTCCITVSCSILDVSLPTTRDTPAPHNEGRERQFVEVRLTP